MKFKLKTKKLKSLNKSASINQAQTPNIAGGSSYASNNGYTCSGSSGGREPTFPVQPH
ncbi:hypothetical protein [Pseudoalteromonas luteoviolacea]|uniref:Uncharacterized protein n=1 Tax=Pseudoalteromonas luteoviolacea H33 TaxID=1365251 RepID=A0A167BN09_9GAMM|nr:hypothetical protein [Pseudoalteromonas luteoviolacea]KZN46717.1 hypothetical protein N476_24020 [Pseudoalteromonas luteoviolacea H33]KZN78547.1 hypothetical protein N477_26465 [Pseudoalteromonas luteoviolacea H33-S]MBQ4878695.1 hypothetical protein [Pseudoalteromonas luteoviolacea]MBQ4907235.1 hypothetical protein [Pseudoalteromonas luteoviolacea]